RALAAPAAREAERCLAHIDTAAVGAHQRFVLDVALARSALLHGAGTTEQDAGREARRRLERSLARGAEGAEFAERPLARIVLFAHACSESDPGIAVP